MRDHDCRERAAMLGDRVESDWCFRGDSTTLRDLLRRRANAARPCTQGSHAVSGRRGYAPGPTGSGKCARRNRLGRLIHKRTRHHFRFLAFTTRRFRTVGRRAPPWPVLSSSNRTGIFDRQDAELAWSRVLPFLSTHAGNAVQPRALAPPPPRRPTPNEWLLGQPLAVASLKLCAGLPNCCGRGPRGSCAPAQPASAAFEAM